MKKLLIFLSLVPTISLFAYTSEDVDNAELLVEAGIITEQTDAAGYRLDATISRQEMVGIALRLAGHTPPVDYVCKWYYKDAKFTPKHRDAWVCASAELAADNGIITREKTNFRPKSNVTRAEALAMLMKSAEIDYASEAYKGGDIADLYSPRTPEWQIILLEGANALGIIDLYAEDGSPEDIFQPNKPATRAQVFEFVVNIDNALSSGGNGGNEGGELQGSIVEKSNGYTQYTSSEGDFTVSYPSDMYIAQENEGVIKVQIFSDNDAELGVRGYTVVRETCDTADCTYEELYKAFKESLLDGTGITIVKENTVRVQNYDTTLLEYTQNVEGQLFRGYAQVIFTNDQLYGLAGISDEPHFAENQREIQKFLKSLTIHE